MHDDGSSGSKFRNAEAQWPISDSYMYMYISKKPSLQKATSVQKSRHRTKRSRPSFWPVLYLLRSPQSWPVVSSSRSDTPGTNHRWLENLASWLLGSPFDATQAHRLEHRRPTRKIPGSFSLTLDKLGKVVSWFCQKAGSRQQDLLLKIKKKPPFPFICPCC